MSEPAKIIPFPPGQIRGPSSNAALTTTALKEWFSSVEFNTYEKFNWRPLTIDMFPSFGEGNAMPTEQELVDAKIKAATAETNAKLAEIAGEIKANASDLRGDLRAIAAHLNAVEKSTTGVKATIFGVGLASVAIVIGILSFGQQWFGIGVTTRDIIRATIQEQQIQHPSSSLPSNSK